MRRNCGIIILSLIVGLLIGSTVVQAQSAGNSYRLSASAEKPGRDLRLKLSKPVDALSTQEANDAIDILHYNVDLDIDTDNLLIYGNEVIHGVLDTIRTNRLNLNLESLTVDSVKMQTNPVTFIHRDGMLSISLATADTFVVQIWFHGHPGNDGFGGFFFHPKAIYTVGEGIFSDPPSATRHWLPCHDLPADKATLDMKLRVPASLVAVSNGTLISKEMELPEQKILYHWQETHPIATYLIAIAIAEYELITEKYISVTGDTIPLEFYVYPEDLTKAQADFAMLPRMMAFFEQRFGPYPFDRYSMVEVPMRGAMEHQTMTSYSDRWVTGDNRNDAVVAHELAHHWWGDSVTLSDWRDLWLNEGFASYCEALYFESLAGTAALQSTMQEFANAYFAEDGNIGSFSIYDPQWAWGGTVYEKGAWVLHMLRWTIGDSAFWKTMRSYADIYEYGNATITDFVQIAERTSGQDLQWFFDQWIYDAGFPKFNNGWNWSRTPEGLYSVNVSVEQVQRVDRIFTMPVEILLKSQSTSLLDTVWVSDKINTYNFVLTERPLEFVLDPNYWLLKKSDITSIPLPPGFREGDYALAQSYPNPFIALDAHNKTTIVFQVGYADAPTRTTLRIHDVQGRVVRTLVDGTLTPGVRSIAWDGRDEDGRLLPNGTYVYALSAGTHRMMKRLLLLR